MHPFTFFVSYRRQDTAPIALLLKYELEKRLQFVRVVVDVDEISLGDRFPDRLKNLIADAHVTIALIGKNWMPKNGAGNFRAQQDWVLNELEYSASAPLAVAEAAQYGLAKREILPIFADCDGGFSQFEIPDQIAYISQLQSESIYYSNWPSAIGPLLERIATRLKLLARPEKDEYPKPSLEKARTQPIVDMELGKILGYNDYEGWYVDNFGDSEARYLTKTFEFRHFDDAAEFMAKASAYCKTLNHHPEWRNVFNYVSVALTTWDARRKVTIYDLNLALYMNMAAREITSKQ
jgi:4a-hydroxytetrahydrobiopterin dehydratase